MTSKKQKKLQEGVFFSFAAEVICRTGRKTLPRTDNTATASQYTAAQLTQIACGGLLFRKWSQVHIIFRTEILSEKTHLA